MSNHRYDSYEEVLSALESHGITGKYLYLAELFPLIEVIWADGMNQEAEITIFYKALVSHLRQINCSLGYQLFTYSEAKVFFKPFIQERPSEDILSLLRRLFVLTLDSVDDPGRKKEIVNSLLSYSLDIASSSVTQYPYKNNERFDQNEKRCFFSILSDIGVGTVLNA